MRAAVAIGANLGDRAAAIRFAAARLAPLLSGLVVSAVVETEPEGDGLDDQPLYLNAVAVGDTTLPARDLLAHLLDIERQYGRTRPAPGAARTLDLDLVLLGDQVIDEPGLTVPHPRFRQRFFVLGPLAGIAPDLVDPVTGARVADLLRALLGDTSR